MPGHLISVAAARDRVLSSAHALDAELVPVADALDRVLAVDVVAALEVPPFPSSAMDGYAVHPGVAGRTLTVVAESRAGAPTEAVVKAGQAVRVSTGAAVPTGASGVIRQEDVIAQEGQIVTLLDIAAGQNIRRAGEVMRPGDVVLNAGAAVGPAELGAAVTAGVAQISAYGRPRVSVLCTGDELRDPGATLGPGEIHNSNGPMLVGYALHSGAVPLGLLLLPDERVATERALEAALEEADVVIVSGGVSVGPHDHVKPALAELGVRQEFWGVALQPGKPTWFGTRDRTLVFGLPGNPVSTAVTFALFVAPALRRLGGQPEDRSDPAEAQLEGGPIKQNPLREQALRVRIEHHEGAAFAHVNGAQGSHVITSLLGADALALIPPGEGQIEPGTRLALQPLARYTVIQ